MSQTPIADMRSEELEERLKDLEGYLRGIAQGEGPQERRVLYESRGKAQSNLDFNCPMGEFSEYSPGYISKVLFAEAVIKLYIDFHGCEYQEAEDALFKIDLTKVSYMC
jgi:hypothetical protein